MSLQSWKEEFEGKNILIYGYGIEGRSTYRLIRRLCPDQIITIADGGKGKETAEKETLHTICISDQDLDLSSYDLVMKAPGVVLKPGTDLSSISGQAQLFLKHYRQRTIGITGTKGKSTTTSLVAAMLKEKYPTVLVGNIGIACFDAIDEMDEIMKSQFKETFDKINSNLNDTFRNLFGGGKASLILEDENDILNTGIDIDVQPPGKSVKSIRLFSGGEKTLIALCVLFTIIKVKPAPLIIFDEVEAALDQANVERFAKYVKKFEDVSQFLIITHRPGTMAECDTLYGVTMQQRGVSQMLKVKLVDALEMAERSEVGE